MSVSQRHHLPFCALSRALQSLNNKLSCICVHSMPLHLIRIFTKRYWIVLKQKAWESQAWNGRARGKLIQPLVATVLQDDICWLEPPYACSLTKLIYSMSHALRRERNCNGNIAMAYTQSANKWRINVLLTLKYVLWLHTKLLCLRYTHTVKRKCTLYPMEWSNENVSNRSNVYKRQFSSPHLDDLCI